MPDQTPGSSPEIDALLQEDRRFEPSAAFRAAAHANDPGIYERAAKDPEGFWAGFARELEWSTPWTTVLEWTPPYAKWFIGGTLNASVNCVDRHARGTRRNKAALVWEGEPGDRRTLTYFDLYRQVSQFANVLKGLGVGRGDRVAIYMPLIPELAIAMLACARIGAVHNVVFGGFSADSLRDRINDSQCKVLVTADGGYRRGNVVPLKQMADEALAATPSITSVVVVRRGAADLRVHMQAGRDHWYHELMQDASYVCPPEPMDAEDMLYILYTSGTTGKPKGIVHTTGGYLTGCYATTKWVFDLKEDDVYWCTADIGWVTGHSYVVYGPLANGATVVMYEGAPDWPKKDRFWEIIERYGVTVFYTAPTAIRAFMRWGTEWPAKRDLSSLRLLGSVGEPINPEAWVWYHLNIGRERCPVVDTWWQTETGAIIDHAAAGHHQHQAGVGDAAVPGHQRPDPHRQGRAGCGRRRAAGADAAVAVDAARHLRRPRALRAAGTWSRWPGGIYFTGDGAKLDDDGFFWLLGRVDDVLNVAGHRLGTMEVESALVDHPKVAEAAVVGRHHEIKGQAVAAFVTVKEGVATSEALADELKAARRPEDRRHCPARRHHLRRRPAQDAVGQDHAPAAARHRRRQGPRRHDDAGRSRRRRPAEGAVRRRTGLRTAAA